MALHIEHHLRFELVFFPTDDMTEKTQPELIDLTLSEVASPELINLVSPEKRLREIDEPELIDLVSPEKSLREIDEPELIDLVSPKIHPQTQQTSWGATVRRCLFADSDDDRDTTSLKRVKVSDDFECTEILYLCIK